MDQTLLLNEGDEIDAGTVIAKVQRESTKTKDITGGLPRVAELFEARKPANSAQIADIAEQLSLDQRLEVQEEL